VSSEAYYATLFHELVHSTGHETRLARPGVVQPAAFASHIYSREELVAEMGATFLGSLCGLTEVTIENSASYLASWLRVLRGEPKLLIQAAAQAQRAIDHLRGRTETPAEQAGESEVPAAA
jgi:antirestriction protein ArdC